MRAEHPDHLLIIRQLHQLRARVPTPGARRATDLVLPWSMSAAVGFILISLVCPVSVSIVTTDGLVLSLIFTGCRSVLQFAYLC
jgi:hypothetical protein